MKDFLCFKKLAAPIIVQILFWMGIAVWGIKLYDLIKLIRHGQFDFMTVLTIIVVWPLMLRLYCEIIMLLFNINENLVKLNQKNNQ